MDYARKLGKTKPSSLRTRSGISLNLQNPTTSSIPLIEDNKLSNWKKWLDDRKKHQEAFKKILGRNENELLLNSGEKYRSIVETRELMEFAADPLTEACLTKNIDLNFWITPEVLPNHGNLLLPEIEVPSKRKSNSIRKFVHVASPDLVLEEKGLSKPPEFKHEYLEEKTKKLANIISIIEPNPPKMGRLFVQGKNFKRRTKEGKKIQKLPVITITTAEETERETSEWSINPDAMIAALRIEDKEIVRRLNPKFGYKLEDNGPYNWDIKFCCKVDETLEKMVFFENKGNIKISFNWRPVFYNPVTFPSRKREISSFFFNKNNGIILPGQIFKFHVWFKSSKPGIKTENWRFVTDPVLTSEDISFRFWGCCTEENAKENICKLRIQGIEKYLDNQIRDSVIKEILEEIVNDALTFQPSEPPYKDLFLESEIFSAKNPSYFYNSILIKEFREIHYSLFNSDGPEWNLSILDLRNLLLKIEDPEIRQETLFRFVNLCKAALKPIVFSSTKNEKYEKVYNLFCSFVNQFETESESVKNICFESCQMETESLTFGNEAQSRSNNLSRISSGKLTPKSKIKPKKKSKKGQATENRKVEERTKNWIISKPSDIILYKETFYLRIYEILGETISKACAVIDSFMRLNEPEK